MNPLSMLVEEAEAAVAILRPLKCRRKDFGQNLAVVAVVGKDCWNLNHKKKHFKLVTFGQKIKKVEGKKTREINFTIFLTKIHFMQFRKWPKINF